MDCVCVVDVLLALFISFAMFGAMWIVCLLMSCLNYFFVLSFVCDMCISGCWLFGIDVLSLVCALSAI